MDASSTIVVNLSKAEALVLSDFLWRFDRTRRLEIEHPAEERALTTLLAAIERGQEEPFQSDYAQLLEQARDEVATSTESTDG